MKFYALLFLFLSNSVFALSGKEAWVHTNMQGKVLLLKEYTAFFAQLQRTETFDKEVVQNKLLEMIFSSAWAAENMDCIYAGWPSKRIGSSCSSPAKQNPDYQNGSCGLHQLQCQPLLFGKGLCISVAKPKERSLAFTNCQKLSKKTPEALIREIRADGNEKGLFELLDFADRICKEGAQKGTGMCARLTAAVDRLRHFKNEGTARLAVENPETRSPAVTSATSGLKIAQQTSTEVSGQPELLQTVNTADRVMNAVYDKDCEPELVGEPFDREEPRPINVEYTTSRSGPGNIWDNSFVKDKNSEELRPTGFELTNVGPNAIAGDPLDPREKTERKWSFTSEDNSRRETYIWITDDAGSGYLSQLMESVILLVPRKMKPKVETVGEDLIVTLTTGEKVIYDKKTKMIKAGTLREGKIDSNPNRHVRKFAPVTYHGTGISIRVDKRGEDPRLIPGNAVITQNGKTCQVPAKELWHSNTDFKFADDTKLVEFLNKKCGKKFNL